MLSLVVRLDF